MNWNQEDLDVFNRVFQNPSERGVLLRSIGRAYALLALPVELLEQFYVSVTTGPQVVVLSDQEQIRKFKEVMQATGSPDLELIEVAKKLFENDIIVLEEIIRLKKEGKLPVI